LMILGLLLSHQPFLDRTNVIGDELNDAWGHDVITNRKQFKTVMRQIYGSGMSASEMWTAMKIPYTAKEARAFQNELEHGSLAVAYRLKEFIMDNCRPQTEMTLHVIEHYNVKCNKFHNVGEVTKQYRLFDTVANGRRTIHHTKTKRVPDLKSFKRYSVTGMVHNLDSAVMDSAVEAVYAKCQWVIDIHDAMILCAEQADYAREVYSNGTDDTKMSLKYIHTNRNKILSNYFTSLNIPASKVAEFKRDVLAYVEPLEEELKINRMCLK